MIKFLIYGYMLMTMSMIMLLLWMYMSINKYTMIFEWLIYKFYSLKFNMFIMFDDISLIFIMIVMFISSIIMFYSIEYINMNKLIQTRFIYLLFLFILSMLLMILSPNILSIMLGWDGLGLTSYCLIIFYQNMKSYSSGMMTIILNRIGDVGLLMLITMMMSIESFNLMLFNSNKMIMIMIMIMIMTKSAQMPFSSWLPAAMMAPTPISSLVHSSTLVTAGIYLLIRYINLVNNNCLLNILLLSSSTYLMASFIANYEYDIKKVIAFSTLSQLGLMMSILSMKMYNLAFLHLVIHAMFKSLMFMCAGSFIHYLNNNQNIRNYKGMIYLYPFKSLIFTFSNLCLCGFPFLGAFYSKDLIMEFFLMNKMNMLSMLNLMLGTMFSLSYSMRLKLIFIYPYSSKFNFLFIKENLIMSICMMIMMMFTMFFSKFYMNLKFIEINNILPFFLKIMICKIVFMSSFLGYYHFYNLNGIKDNYMGKLSKNLFYLNMIYKSIYFMYLMKASTYEMYFDKNLMLIYATNYNKLKNMFNSIKIMKIFENLSFMLYMYLMIFTI